jgi:hypothetical protein
VIKDSKNIENLFKQQFQDLEIRPEKHVWRTIDKKLWLPNFKFYIEHLFKQEPLTTNERVWKNISRRLWWEDYLSFNLAKFNVYYSSAAIVLIAFFAFNFSEQINTQKQNLISKIKNEIVEQKPILASLSHKNIENIKQLEIQNSINTTAETFENKTVADFETNNNENNNSIEIIEKNQEIYNLNLQKYSAGNLLNYNLCDNKVKQLKKRKWYLDVYTKLSEPINNNSEKLKNVKSEMVGLTVGYTLNNFILELGVAVGQTDNLHLNNDSISIVKNIKYNYLRVDTAKISFSDSLLAVNQSNSFNWKQDSLNLNKLDTTSIYEIIKSTDLYKSVEIPIMFGYQLSQGNLSCAIKGGLISALYFKPTDVEITKKDNNTKIVNRDILVKSDLSMNLSLGFEFKLSNSVSLLSEPYFRQTLNSIFANETKYVQRYNSYGMKLGVRYHF